MESLSGLDGAFLALETPRQPLHAAMAAVVDTSGMAEPYCFETFREWAREEAERQPLLRRRVREVPFGLDHPRWEEEPEVDLDAHLSRVTLAPGAGFTDLWRLAGDFVSRPLDRGKPLWEAWVVEGLGRHRVAVLSKVHHAAVDGVSAALTMAELLDDGPGRKGAPAPAGRGREAYRRPSDLELLGSGLASLLRLPGQLAEALPATAAGISRLALELADMSRLATDVGGIRRLGYGSARAEGALAAPFRAPRAPFNAALTPHRVVATATFRLSDLRRVSRAYEVTVNDVVLAVCSSALRRHLGRHHDLPAAPLVALVPVAARDDELVRRGRGAAGANRLSAVLVPLPTDRADPIARLRAVADATGRAKAGHAALGPGTLMAWAEMLRPVLCSTASRLYSGLGLANRLPPLCNLVVSNVAGPPKRLSSRGARAEALYPLGPLFEGMGLNVTVFSHGNRLDVGLVACPELLPDLAGLAQELSPGLRELVA
jgi:diacylglycerol O-acyltransferase